MAGIAYPSRALEFDPGFQFFSFLCIVL